MNTDRIAGTLFLVAIIVLFAWSPLQSLYDKHKVTCFDQEIPYQVTDQNDPNSYIGTTTYLTDGIDGSKHVCMRGDGTTVSSTITLQPVNEIDSVGTGVYTIPEPTYSPSSACVTECADGTCSPSTGRGTCSHHGGEAY